MLSWKARMMGRASGWFPGMMGGWSPSYGSLDRPKRPPKRNSRSSPKNGLSCIKREVGITVLFLLKHFNFLEYTSYWHHWIHSRYFPSNLIKAGSSWAVISTEFQLKAGVASESAIFRWTLRISSLSDIHGRSFGHVDEWGRRKEGPSAHPHGVASNCNRVATSAGLSFPGTNRHSSASVRVWIS